MKKLDIYGIGVMHHSPRWTPVLVKWIDPAAYHGWHNPNAWVERAKGDEYIFGMDCTTVGFLIEATWDGLILSRNQHDGENCAGDIFEIPRGVIREIYELE